MLLKKLEKLLKNFLLFLIKIFLPGKNQKKMSMDWRKFKRILIFRFDNRLGNSILILPLIQSIKNSLPAAKVDVLMTSAFVSIFHNHPGVNEIIPYDQSRLLKNPLRYLKLIKQMRRNNYNVVFSSSNPNTLSVSQAIFARLFTNGHSVGFDWKNSSQIYSDVVPGKTDVHYTQSQVDLWRHFDVKAKYELPCTYFTENQIVEQENKVLFWLGATGNKILSAKLVSEILSILNKEKIDFELAAGPGDKAIVSSYGKILRINVKIMRGSILDTALYFKKFPVIIFPDTGPMHLAVALGIPVIQIFVNSNSTWYAYKSEKHFLAEDAIVKKQLLQFIWKQIVVE